MDNLEFQVEENRDILINETTDDNRLEVKLDIDNDAISISIKDYDIGLHVLLTDKQVNNLMFLLDKMLKQKS